MLTVSIVLFGLGCLLAFLGGVAWHTARRLRAGALMRFASAEIEHARATMQLNEAALCQSRAEAALAEARRIEDSLTRPRFAFRASDGRIRALRANEDPALGEIPCREPDPNCKVNACRGRGWTGRRLDGGTYIPCECVRLRGGGA